MLLLLVMILMRMIMMMLLLLMILSVRSHLDVPHVALFSAASMFDSWRSSRCSTNSMRWFFSAQMPSSPSCPWWSPNVKTSHGNCCYVSMFKRIIQNVVCDASINAGRQDDYSHSRQSRDSSRNNQIQKSHALPRERRSAAYRWFSCVFYICLFSFQVQSSRCDSRLRKFHHAACALIAPWAKMSLSLIVWSHNLSQNVIKFDRLI